MSIVIPELSVDFTATNFTTPSVVAENYSQISYFVVSSVSGGTFTIQGSVDGSTWYGLLSVSIASSGTPYTNKINITTKFIRFVYALGSSGTVTPQAFFFDEGNIIINNTIGGGVSAVTATGPIASSGGSTPNISISQSTASTDGYLSSTDWNTFNSKGSGTVTSVTSLGAPIIITSNTTTPLVKITQSTASTDGYLSSTDWNTFNSKGSGSVTSIGTGSGLSGGPITGSGTISITNTGVTPGSYTTASLTVNSNGQLTACSSGSAGVTSVATGIGLSGGPITTTGTVSIANTAVTAGSYTNLNATINAQGQVTAASNGTSSSGTVTSVSATAPLHVTSPTTTPALTIDIANTSQPGAISASDWNSFNSKGVGSVTSVGTSTGLTGGPITGSGSISIANTGVSANTYTVPTLTVNAQGQITSASSGSAVTSVASGTGLTGGPITSTGTLGIATTGVTAAAYKNNASFTVNAQGQLSSAASGTPGASGTVLMSNGTDYVNSTLTIPSTITANKILYSSASNTVSGITAGSSGVLCCDSSGDPLWEGLSNGQVIIGSTGGTPIGATLTQGSGLSITNAANSITLALPTSGVTAGSYGSANLTVNSLGIITACSNGGSPSSYGKIYNNVPAGSLTYTIDLTTPLEMAGNGTYPYTLDSGSSSDFVMTTDGRLLYLGSTTKKFLCCATFGSVGGNYYLNVGIRKNGVAQSNAIATNENLAVHVNNAIISMATNDYLSIWAYWENLGNSSYVCYNVSLSALSIS